VKIAALLSKAGNLGREFFWSENCYLCRKLLLDYEYYICNHCLDALPVTRITSQDPIPCFSLAEHTGDYRRFIHTIKYEERWALGRQLGKKLAREAKGYLQNQSCDSVVAVPIHRLRRMRRGYNQAEEIAFSLSRELGLSNLTGSLVRARFTESQVGKGHNDRYTNVLNAFTCRHPKRVQGKSIALVDDVITSGATIRECASVLLEAGAKAVFGLSLTRAGISQHIM
jgi:ComF family protein